VGEAPSPPREDCPRCGSPVARGQEYCLECGARLPVAEHELVRAPAAWLWPVLVALVVAAVAAAGVVAWRVAADGGDPELIAATTEQPAVIPTTAPPEPSTTATPTTTAAPTTAPATTAAPPPPPPQDRVVSWPAGRAGYTVVLASIPEAGGRAGATARAREAIGAGLQQVGVLRSGDFATLHPGYFVVFSGIYGSMAEAEDGVAAARRAGYDTPYARQIAR
jgi:hypothetical protein